MQAFQLLHQQEKPLLMCNVWDVASAKVAEAIRFDAIGTSSAAIASTLGYQDGEQMTFDALLFIVERIALCSDLPLTVDIEGGYSRDPIEVASNIRRLAEVGVVGINIEDSFVNGERSLRDKREFSQFLATVIRHLPNEMNDLFVNVRTDTYLLNEPKALQETKQRAALYEHAGASGIFVPGLSNLQAISELVSCTNLPINVMCWADLPHFDVLGRHGIKRISMGNALFDYQQRVLTKKLIKIRDNGTFQSIF